MTPEELQKIKDEQEIISQKVK